MADIVDPATRSRMMSGIRGKNTKPERDLRRELWRRGLRFRIHDRSIPGTPDISHRTRKVAVFVDGCFWHACPKHFRKPSTRQDFWEAKISANRARRKRVLAELRREHWRVLQVWECTVRADAIGAANRVEALLVHTKPTGKS